MIHVTALYAAIIGIIAIWLGSRPGLLRGKTKISVGDGGNPDLLLAMRRHANFAEWVPLTLIIIALLEMQGAPRIAIHCLGAALIIFRLAHAQGLRGDSIQGAGRAIGAFGTVLVLGIASIWNIVLHFV